MSRRAAAHCRLQVGKTRTYAASCVAGRAAMRAAWRAARLDGMLYSMLHSTLHGGLHYMCMVCCMTYCMVRGMVYAAWYAVAIVNRIIQLDVALYSAGIADIKQKALVPERVQPLHCVS